MKRLLSLLLALTLILSLAACGTAGEAPQPREKKEYLFATMTAYTNGANDDGGVDLLVYCLDIAEGTWEKLMEIPYRGSYPANCADLVAGKLYYAADAPGQDYDNLFVYDLASGESSQLTYGKFYFDDLLVIDGRLYANSARRYATVCQPAVFDPEAQDFRYFDEEDDDTWHYSMSYHDGTGQLLILTCSDAVMRTHRVAAARSSATSIWRRSSSPPCSRLSSSPPTSAPWSASCTACSRVNL